MTQAFPEGAATRHAFCRGVFCQGRLATVVKAWVGPSWRQGVAMDLCADCLADFAIASTDVEAKATMAAYGLPGDFKVYALGQDGLYHQVEGKLPDG